ncbi:MAG: divergent polysaccharide deacetylase family protein, partial [Thermoanaerobaculales bacterium]
LVVLAAERGVGPEAISADDPIRKVDGIFVRTWRLSFPSREARDGFLGDLQIEGAARDAELSLPEDLSSQEIALEVGLGVETFDLRLALSRPSSPPTRAPATPAPTPIPTPTVRPEPPPNARGRLAILLDDGGQKLDLVAQAAALPTEVGIAILPFLPYSAETAEEMFSAGHEVWLHLPMEPEGYPGNDPGAGAVLVGMEGNDLQTTIHSAINNIPHAIGVNNHMGSKASADLRLMTWVMQELKARGMAFIDSRTTVRTVAEEAARAQGVPTNRRHVFLDNKKESAAIRRQLEEAIYRCRIEGEIIAIGHLSPVTLRVLAQELPGLKKRGADLVAPSKLVR